MLGMISLKRIFQRLMPKASAARTKSRCATSSVAARATRAMRGAWPIPTMSTMSQSWGPRIDTNSSASTICGKASTTSRRRMMDSSIQRRA